VFESGECSDKCGGEILKWLRRRNFIIVGTVHSVVLKSIHGRDVSLKKMDMDYQE
jgi:hypothetical protein